MFNNILDLVSKINTPGFFLTVECSRTGEKMPGGIECFVNEKLSFINQGNNSRKFVFQEEGWRLIITFFPTDQVVDEKYALKNKVYKRL